jgi:rubrerythrin
VQYSLTVKKWDTSSLVELGEIAPVKKGYYMAAEDNAKRCPFCGSDFIDRKFDGERFYYLCRTCLARGPKCASQEFALAKWDRRPDTMETGATSHNSESTQCPVCSRRWDMERFTSCECGASIKRD